MHMVMLLLVLEILIMMSIFHCIEPSSRTKDLVLDTDVDIEDVLAILYILKQNKSLVNLKAITINANAWINPGFGVNMVYDVLHMMGRDDIPLGIGGEGGITYNGTILPNVGGYLPLIDQMMSTAGSCRYREAIPGGSLDIDTNYGLRRKFLPQGPRHYVPGKQKTAQEVLKRALASGSNTVVLVGSHTNFALLLATHPQFKKNVEHVYIMGGGESGNIFTAVESNPRAEYNLYGDPFAAYQVFHSGLPITMVPLEATDTVPVTDALISTLEANMRTLEANYTYQTLSMVKQMWPKTFSQYFFLWDTFTSSIAISGMLNGHVAANNEFAIIVPSRITVVTSNKPYGVHDGSNPMFESEKWIGFHLENDGVHSGHVQTGLQDPFCYMPRGRGTCMDGCTVPAQGKEGAAIYLARSARENNKKQEKNPVSKPFYSSFIQSLNCPFQTSRFSMQAQFPYLKENESRPNKTSLTVSGAKPVVFDMDMSPGDMLALIYLLKNPHAVDLKAVTVAANGWSNAAAIDMVYDVLHMMGRDDIPVRIGAFFALGQAYGPGNTTGGCKYRRAVPQGAGGLLDSDTLYGLSRELPRSPRSYTAGMPASFGVSKTHTAHEELVKILRSLEGGSQKLTILTGGPLTNIAQLLLRSPDLEQLIEEVYILGGSINAPGNVFTLKENKRAEFNVFLDPRAAEVVLSSSLQVTLVPLDVTSRVSSSSKFLRLLKPKRACTPESRLAWKLFHTVDQLNSSRTKAYKIPINPLSEVVAAALLTNSPNLVNAVLKGMPIMVRTNDTICLEGWTCVDEDKGTHIQVLQSLNTLKVEFIVADALAGTCNNKLEVMPIKNKAN